MKLPGRIQSALDELEIESSAKAKVKKFILDMGETLPEHPTPEEVKRIIKGAMKHLEVGKKAEEPEAKEEKPKKEKAEKKEEVKESKRLSFKEFVSEADGKNLGNQFSADIDSKKDASRFIYDSDAYRVAYWANDTIEVFVVFDLKSNKSYFFDEKTRQSYVDFKATKHGESMTQDDEDALKEMHDDLDGKISDDICKRYVDLIKK
jgi:hypothetical protein